MSQLTEKSELLFLYESTFSQPNGDPFTGEQRYDDETKKILVSDVRIKRFIRDFFIEENSRLNEDKHEVYVIDSEKLTQGGKDKESGSAIRINFLATKDKFKAEFGDVAKASKANKQQAKAEGLLKKCIDVRLFGGISTKEGAAVNITGPTQFALLNPSLNSVDMRMHQNTSVFASSEEKSRGAIGTTTLVPYAVCQIHGWINPYSAKLSGMSTEDETEMLKALWKSVNNSNTRSKSGQNSLLLLQIVYANADDKVYGVERLVKLASEKRGEQLRDSEDFKFDFSKLNEAAQSPKVKAIRFYTEIKEIENALTGGKFHKIQL
jgi:CRISPR-associated protein Csh2